MVILGNRTTLSFMNIALDAIGPECGLRDDSDDLAAHASAYIRGAIRAAETIHR
jgi:hypothetical protein